MPKGIYKHHPNQGFQKGNQLHLKRKIFPFKGLPSHLQPNWKGGRYIDRDGYILIKNKKHPFASHGYIREHRLIMEKHLKRFLKPKERIHHKNGNKFDNRFKNLKLFSNESEHQKYHNQKLRCASNQTSFMRCI